MNLKSINSPNAPQAIGHYSQAVEAGGLIFCSGQLGLYPQTGELASADVAVQTKQAMENLSAVLQEAGSNLSQVVRCDVFLKNIDDFKIFNEVYQTFFSAPPYPARQTVEVSNLPKNAAVEISCVALTPSNDEK